MAEYINREAVHNLVKSLPKYQMFDYERTKSLVGINPDDVDFGVDAIPAAAVAEVVRCRECKHYHANTGWCNQLSYFQNSDGEPCSPAESMEWKMFMEDDFCSYGQRKETTHEVSE